MKPIEQLFLDDILEWPGRDFPRLVYADWLEENGQPERAEFIRVQCALAKMPGDKLVGGCSTRDSLRIQAIISSKDERFLELRRREWELLPANAWDWAGNVFRNAWVAGTHYQDTLVFRRGFVEEITIPLADWLRHGPALVKAAPLQVVRLSDYKPRREVNAWFYPNNLLEWIPETEYFYPAVKWGRITEAEAVAVMSRCCLEYAHGQNTEIVPT